MSEVTKEQVKAAIDVVFALSETIRVLKKIPSGHLYVRVMGQMSHDQYQSAIDLLKRTGLVKEEAYELCWAGPELPSNGR